MGDQMVTAENYIGGKYVPYSGEYLDSVDPSTGKVWARIPDSGAEEVELAVDAASKAFPGWSGMTVAGRAEIMRRVADLVEERLEEFAKAESRDQGKPVSVARTIDIPRVVLNFRFFASAIMHHIGTSNHLRVPNAVEYTQQVPRGVAGLISPWNLPLYLLSFKIAPAIAAGNTVVAKPSEMTSITAWMLCDVFEEAGLPPGVVNLVFGTGPRVGDAMVKHPRIPTISFTGSTVTAEQIRKTSAPFSKKLSLELGGKNPGVVFADVDLEKCIPTLIRACFSNQGEICLCVSRLFVQRQIFDRFLSQFVVLARTIKVGDPRDPDTQMGALISRDHLAKVRGFVELARAEGAVLQCGDGVDELKLEPENAEGYFMQPTVITDMADSSRLMQEEIFGPVVCLVPFDTPEEVVERANQTVYGLSASVWTNDLTLAHTVASKIECGTCWVNCWLVRDLNMPFGGVKASGVGREGCRESLDFFTDVKTICIKL